MTFFAKTNAQRGELYLYDAIGADFFGEGLTAKSVQEALAGMKNVTGLDIFINSPGGEVFEGVAIYNQIARFDTPKKVHIDGLAASIASVIAMVGDEIVIADNAMMMIHDPWGLAIGTAAELRKTAETMDQVRDTLVTTYCNRTGQDAKQINAWMADETWMNAKQCVERGFANATTKEGAVASTETQAATQTAAFLAKFKKTPAHLKPSAAAVGRATLARMDMRINRLRTGASPRSA